MLVRTALKRAEVPRLLMSSVGNTCPCHKHTPTATTSLHPRWNSPSGLSREYAFEMASSNIRFGEGVTSEIGMDCKNLRANKVLVITDPKLVKLPPVLKVIESLEREGLNYQVFDKVQVEPTDSSFQLAIDYTRNYKPDLIIAVGGGSSIDTAKAANLFLSYPDKDLLEFVNPPIGKGTPVDKVLNPLIAVPTTAGTGSETTGSSIFDYVPLKAKTGIAHRALKPLLGIVDPLNTRTMPKNVHLASGLDVLCHALESYTAIPYYMRTPRPDNPIKRPAYQGSNPISDIWSFHALKMTIEYLPRAVNDPEDHDAHLNMLLAATFAGIGFGNAGVHLCHGMSYPISGLNKSYTQQDYEHVGKPLIPHGISVAVTAPAVFEFTGPACPDRHLQAAGLFGADIAQAKESTGGQVLADQLRNFLAKLKLPNGLEAMGFGRGDIDNLVKGTLPQHRVTKLSPREVEQTALENLFSNSMKLY